MQHDWVPSNLGHGETMCRRCFVTNREAAVLGMAECDVPTPAPLNDNKPPERQWTQDEIDLDNEYDDEEQEDDGAEDCGRWNNGELGYQCAKAGSEECDWECPIGLPSRAGLRRRNTKSA